MAGVAKGFVMCSVKVSDLQGVALDWAVAKAEGLPVRRDPMGFGSGSESGFWLWEATGHKLGRYGLIGREYSPSTKWEQGGPIVDELRDLSQYQFLIEGDGESTHVLSWPKEHVFYSGRGATTLIAIMRCFVASKMGDFIEVPASLSNSG